MDLTPEDIDVCLKFHTGTFARMVKEAGTWSAADGQLSHVWNSIKALREVREELYVKGARRKGSGNE